MLPFRVFAKLQSRPQTPIALSPRPLIHSRHSTPRLPLLQSLLFPVVHPISLQPFTKCSSRNSFALKTIHFHGGCTPLFLVSFRMPRDPLSLLFATHTDSTSCKSFLCHSYENTGGVYQLFPLWNSRVVRRQQPLKQDVFQQGVFRKLEIRPSQGPRFSFLTVHGSRVTTPRPFRLHCRMQYTALALSEHVWTNASPPPTPPSKNSPTAPPSSWAASDFAASRKISSPPSAARARKTSPSSATTRVSRISASACSSRIARSRK